MLRVRRRRDRTHVDESGYQGPGEGQAACPSLRPLEKQAHGHWTQSSIQLSTFASSTSSGIVPWRRTALAPATKIRTVKLIRRRPACRIFPELLLALSGGSFLRTQTTNSRRFQGRGDWGQGTRGEGGCKPPPPCPLTCDRPDPRSTLPYSPRAHPAGSPRPAGRHRESRARRTAGRDGPRPAGAARAT